MVFSFVYCLCFSFFNCCLLLFAVVLRGSEGLLEWVVISAILISRMFPMSFEAAVYRLGLLLADAVWFNSNGLL